MTNQLRPARNCTGHNLRFLNGSNLIKGALLLLLPLGTQTAQCLGRENGNGAVHTLSNYIVVATKTPLPQAKVSPSVSLLTTKEIEERQYRDLADLLRTLPGIAVTSSGQSGAVTSLFSRGTNSDHTVFYLNGRKLNPGFSGNYNLAQLGLNNVESVQIMRGASSTLYGPEGIGGVVAIVGSRGSSTPELDFRAEAGSFGTIRLRAGASAAFDRLDTSLGVSYYETDNDEPNSDYRQFNLQSHLGWKLNKSLELDLQSLYLSSRGGTPDNRKSTGYPKLNDFQRNQSWLLSPGFRLRIGDNMEVRLFYAHTEDEPEAFTTFIDFFTGNPFSLHTISRTITDQIDLQVDLDVGQSVLVTAGLVYLNHDFLQFDKVTNTTPFDNSWHSMGVFGQAQWNPTEHFFLTAGLRYDDYSDFDSPVTGNLTVSKVLKPWRLTLFAKYANAYAVPQAFDLYGPFGNPNLDAEESDSLEIGFKHSALSEKLNWSALYYINDITGLITGFPTKNVGKAKTYGIELSMSFEHSPNFRFYGNYTYLTAENLDRGNRLLRRPRHQVFAGLTAKPWENTLFGFEIRHLAGREDIDGGAFFRLDASDYTVAIIHANWSPAEKWKIFARIENLFDKRYDEADGFRALGRSGYIGANFRY